MAVPWGAMDADGEEERRTRADAFAADAHGSPSRIAAFGNTPGNAAVSGALAGAALRGAYGAAPPLSAPPPQGAAEPPTNLPTDLLWPTESEVADARLLSHTVLETTRQVRPDAWLPAYTLEMRSVCTCKGADVNCLLELYGCPASEAWVTHKRCTQAAGEVARIRSEEPRRAPKSRVAKGFDTIGGYRSGSKDVADSTAPTAEAPAPTLAAQRERPRVDPQPAAATMTGSTAEPKRGALMQHRRGLKQAKADRNALAERELVRLAQIELLGPRRRVCASTLCWMVGRSAW